VHAADKDVSETIKRTNLPYFTLDGNICALLGAKDHVNTLSVRAVHGKTLAPSARSPAEPRSECDQ
jgi:hypothetical protein